MAALAAAGATYFGRADARASTGAGVACVGGRRRPHPRRRRSRSATASPWRASSSRGPAERARCSSGWCGSAASRHSLARRTCRRRGAGRCRPPTTTSRSCRRTGCPRCCARARSRPRGSPRSTSRGCKRLNPTLNCVVTLLETQALAEARKADAEIAAGRYRGPLHGVPYGLKDLFSTRGIRTTWGVPDFKDRVIDEDAEIVVRLRDAGAVLVAKLSTGIFAQNDQWFGGRTNNPWNLVARIERVVGGTGIGGGCRLRRVRDRHGDAGVDRVAGDPLRHHRPAADVRPRQPLRRHGARVVAGPRRADVPHRRGLRDGLQRAARRRREGPVDGHDAVPVRPPHRPRAPACRRRSGRAEGTGGAAA